MDGLVLVVEEIHPDDRSDAGMQPGEHGPGPVGGQQSLCPSIGFFRGLEDLDHRLAADFLDDPSRLDARSGRGEPWRHVRHDHASIDHPDLQAQHAGPVVGVLEVLLQLGGDDREVGLMQSLERVVHGVAGLGHGPGMLDLGSQFVMDGLPVETAELGIEMPVADGLPDDLE